MHIRDIAIDNYTYNETNSFGQLYGEEKPYQATAAKKILEIYRTHNAVVLNGGTGTGKSVVMGMVIKAYLNELAKLKLASMQMVRARAIIIAPKATIASLKRELYEFFGLAQPDVEVVSYSQLRSTYGKDWIEEIPNLDPDNVGRVTIKTWKNQDTSIPPALIFFDESQNTANEGTQQHEIAMECIHLAEAKGLRLMIDGDKAVGTKFLLGSATHASYAKQLDVAVHLRVTSGYESFYGGDKREQMFSAFSTNSKKARTKFSKEIFLSVCGGSDPMSLTGKAMDKVKAMLTPITVRIPPIRHKYKNTTLVCIRKPSEKAKKNIDKAIEDYNNECAMLGKKDGTKSVHNGKMVAMMKLMARCELEHAEPLAQMIAHDVKEGFQVNCSVTYKNSIAAIIYHLISTHGFAMKDIALVWGGKDDMNFDSEDLMSVDEMIKIMTDALEGNVSNLEDIDKVIAQVRAQCSGIFEPLQWLNKMGIDLGAMHTDERNAQLQEYQLGKRSICIYTLGAGSVGLNANHSWKEMFFSKKYKSIKRDESMPGFCLATKLDGSIETVVPRPRRCYHAPTWSSNKLVQALGRGHRIDSESPTIQRLMLYAGTFQIEIAHALGHKLNNMAAFIGANEDWMQLVARDSEGNGTGIKTEYSDKEETIDFTSGEVIEGEDGDEDVG